MKKRSKKKQKKKNRNKKTSSTNSRKIETFENTHDKFHYQIGCSVIVKKGVSDPDYGTDIGGWTGKIYDIDKDDDPLVCIEWDYKTQSKMPTSMIEACEKDNLNYKKMYLYASDVEPDIPGEKKDKIILKTMTQEIFMLARIYYDIFDKEKVQTIFSSLGCMAFDPTKDRWVWLYEAETKHLKLAGSYYDTPEERRPIVLGSFYSNSDGEMYLNVNSFDRAKKAIVFFDKHIPRTVAKVTDMEILNKVFDHYDGILPNHDDYFKNETEIQNPESGMDEIIDITSSVKNPIEKLKLAVKHMEKKSKQSLPELERFPIHYYEDGMGGLDGFLSIRETIALEHWAGNKDFTFYDIMKKII